MDSCGNTGIKENRNVHKILNLNTGDYVVKKKFKNGKHAKFVFLLENPKTGHLLIKKRYYPEHQDIFLNEVMHLEKLKECKFTPKLFKVRPEKLTIYMSYCGDRIKEDDLPGFMWIIKKYKKKLVDHWGIYHNDLKPDNICILQGQIYFIDFGWAHHKKIKPGYGEGRAGVLT